MVTGHHTTTTGTHADGRRRSNRLPLLALRALQLVFAIMLIGAFGWFHRQITIVGGTVGIDVDVPLGFSVAALLFTLWSLANIFFIGERAPLTMFAVDFSLFVGFLASAVIYRNNFNASCGENILVAFFSSIGRSSCNTVRLGAACLVIETILFFLSMVLAAMLSRTHMNSLRTTHGTTTEKRSRFGRRRGHTTGVV